MTEEITYTIAGAQVLTAKGHRFSLGLHSFSSAKVEDCFDRVKDELRYKWPKKGTPEEWESEGGWYVGKLGEDLVKFKIKATYSTFITNAHTNL